jgi:hypothetical protein
MVALAVSKKSLDTRCFLHTPSKAQAQPRQAVLAAPYGCQEVHLMGSQSFLVVVETQYGWPWERGERWVG